VKIARTLDSTSMWECSARPYYPEVGKQYSLSIGGDKRVETDQKEDASDSRP
jgi:hypothetical protein